ncbi:MAG TPA: acido-empty-quinoprotein group A [Bryobacteraceae bacterium]|nr:acido-empty-quinoprotein group A [Bryobacteraceae bacterium]
MRLRKPLFIAASTVCVFAAIAAAQGLNPADILKPLSDSWPTYSGDYTGKRYSSLTQINQSNVKQLTLAWASRVTPGPGGGGFRGGSSVIVGGEGPGNVNTGGFGGGTSVRASILEVNGILYFSMPDNAWAVDARDGHEIWHYFWKTKGGTHIGNRGLGMWGNWLYMETPDDYLVSLDARTGKERWHKVIADFNQQYFSTDAPIIIGNHVLVGTGDDLDAPAPLQSFDPETGDLQWVWYATPQKKGDPGLETWANLDAAKHGGGQMWIPGSYDPETHLYILGTGNPTPAYTSQSRGPGDNLYTCSLVAINVDTGKLVWHFQTSPHDTHDWDSAQTPILVDAPFNGKMRKLVIQATRNGYFFTLDRVTGEHLVTGKYSQTANWSKGVDERGEPVRIPAKDYDIGGALVSPANGGITNWPPPSFDPETGLFYVPQSDSYAMYYLTETDPRGAMGLGGKEEVGVGSAGVYLTAINYQTGEVAWRHRYPGIQSYGGGNGILTTAGKLLFAGDAGGNLVAYDPETSKILWHSRIGQVSNAPETYMLDGHQYILVAAGDTLFAFRLYE